MQTCERLAMLEWDVMGHKRPHDESMHVPTCGSANDFLAGKPTLNVSPL